MKRITVKFLCLLTLLAVAASGLSCLGDDGLTPEQTADELLNFLIRRSGRESLDDWIKNELIPSPAGGAEWYIVSLLQFGCELDRQAYCASLKNALSEGRVLSASEELKYALALTACGQAGDEYVQKALNQSAGAQGIMSYVYGLHLVNNTRTGGGPGAEEMVSALLSLRKSDGGWAVMGNYSDTDVTAMTLQALAPHCAENEAVRSACEEALAFLSTKQQSDGAFMGFGATVNPESTAQVIIALCSLGVDPFKDQRFLKDGHSAYDGLMLYRLDDGSFSHVLGGPFNATATTQAFTACVSLWRYQNGLSGLYLFTDTHREKAVRSETSGVSYKTVAIAFLALLSVFCCALLRIRGKKSPKNYLFIGGAFVLLSAVILLTNFESTASYYSGKKAEKQDAVGAVTMSIRCDTIAYDHARRAYIPEDGVILPETRFEISSGDSAYQILTEAARQYGIQLDAQGSAIAMTYVKGIAYIYELEYGEQSGWMYYVNGVAPSVNAGEYRLKDGDVVQWMYSMDIGQDVQPYLTKPSGDGAQSPDGK